MIAGIARAGLLVALAVLSRSATAQLARDSSVDWPVSAGSEAERYLRVMQDAGLATPTQWSIRPFSSATISRIAPSDSGHPWSSRLRASVRSGAWVRAIAPELGGIINSGFPYGINDGALWAGRGLTVHAMAGVQGRLGPVDFRLAPEIFRAQNAAFPLAPNGRSGPQRFGDRLLPAYIDLPQRFGEGPYQRLDGGESQVSLRLLGMSGGVSTGSEYWGPASEDPYLLGNNAGGFDHLFLGTDGEQVLGPIHLGLRVVAGRLAQSDYSAATFENRRRSLAGLIVVFGVHQLPNLEIGAARIFENNYPDGGVSLVDILRPLAHGLLKAQRAKAVRNGSGDEPDNQLASLFGRWSFPASGVEVYGEVGRDDNSLDERDLILELDHDMTFMIGASRVWKRPGGGMLQLRAELLNSGISHLDNVREQAPPYYHTAVVQGHTQRGQVLGAPNAFGGGGATIALESFTADGRKSFIWRRIGREPDVDRTGQRDVLHALTFEWLRFQRRVDFGPEATAVLNLNRNDGGDVFNLRVALTGAAHW